MRAAGVEMVLGNEFVEGEPVWSYRAEHPGPRANVRRIVARLEPLVEQLGDRLRAAVSVREPELSSVTTPIWQWPNLRR